MCPTLGTIIHRWSPGERTRVLWRAQEVWPCLIGAPLSPLSWAVSDAVGPKTNRGTQPSGALLHFLTRKKKNPLGVAHGFPENASLSSRERKKKEKRLFSCVFTFDAPEKQLEGTMRDGGTRYPTKSIDHWFKLGQKKFFTPFTCWKARLDSKLFCLPRERAEKNNSCLAEIIDDGGLKLDYLSPTTPLKKSLRESARCSCLKEIYVSSVATRSVLGANGNTFLPVWLAPDKLLKKGERGL